jgi:hypothetical protein
LSSAEVVVFAAVLFGFFAFGLGLSLVLFVVDFLLFVDFDIV